MTDAIAALVRRHDPDRFLTALFAPADWRDALLTLYAFNHELARAREVASDPTLALIRLHWWREVVEGTRKRHEVASPLSDVIAQGLLVPDDLLAIIAAREQEAGDGIETLEEWRSWLLAGAGGLSVAAARLLGAADAESFRGLGAAYGAAGILRGATVLAAQGRCLLPHDLLARHGVSPEEAIADPRAAPVQQAMVVLAREGTSLLRRPALSRSAITRATIAAALPGVLARRDLQRWPRVHHPRRLGDRLAVTFHGLTGRIPA
jgi:phytoene synthase